MLINVLTATVPYFFPGLGVVSLLAGPVSGAKLPGVASSQPSLQSGSDSDR